MIGEPDLRLILGPQEFAVECKRGPSRLWSARSGCSTCVLQCCKSAHVVQVFTHALQKRDKNDATIFIRCSSTNQALHRPHGTLY